MGKHLSKYQTEEDYNNNEDTHVKPHISYIVNPTKKMIYIPKHYIEQYFTIVALEDGLIVKLENNPFNTSEYCIDNGEWISLSANTATPSINTGQKISFKLTNPIIFIRIGTFNVNKAFNVEGNIMSLLYGDDFVGQIDLSGKKNAFYSLFDNCTTLQNAKNLILPATILADGCYMDMFNGCTSLISVPELPATTLVSKCYYNMFEDCTSLTSVPKLPATTLADYCYFGMFHGCTGLRSAPELPATTLASSCYSFMFYGCTGLRSAPELPATTLVSKCYYNMFYRCSILNYIKMLGTDINASDCLTDWVSGVASTGSFIKHSNMTSLPSGESGIPTGWTVEDYNDSNLITFYINNTEYQAEEGMTWEEWINSEYSSDRYVINNEQICGSSMGVVSSSDSSVNAVNIKDTIKPNVTYKLAFTGGSE